MDPLAMSSSTTPDPLPAVPDIALPIALPFPHDSLPSGLLRPPAPEPDPPRLIVNLDVLAHALPAPTPLNDITKRPRAPPEVRNLTSHFEHHPSADPLPAKGQSRARQPGARPRRPASRVSLISFRFRFSTWWTSPSIRWPPLSQRRGRMPSGGLMKTSG